MTMAEPTLVGLEAGRAETITTYIEALFGLHVSWQSPVADRIQRLTPLQDFTPSKRMFSEGQAYRTNEPMIKMNRMSICMGLCSDAIPQTRADV
jgi:hypothetical protein